MPRLAMRRSWMDVLLHIKSQGGQVTGEFIYPMSQLRLIINK
jgi:hypothetical protein